MREKYEPQAIENEIAEFWKKNRTYENIKKRNKGKKKFFHLDGPPYVTGEPHPGTAWNRAMKDVFRRYKRMSGFDVWDQPGFDMHGLPIENQVENKYGLHNKKEVEEFGITKFTSECREYAVKYKDVMTRIFSRLGEWAEWDNPYMTIKNSYIEGVWWMIKQAWKKELLYEGFKVLTWCARCGTALAPNYEVVHKTLKENSIFVKLPVKGKKNEYLIIWTTTPWTMPCNMAVMAHPELDYVRVKVENETWIMALGLVHGVLAQTDKKYEIIEQFKGEKLLGVKYEHPFEKEVPYHKEEHGKYSYSVILSDKYVDLSAGSGLVHCAPGCGPEDYEVGMEYGIPAFNPVDQYGRFTDKGGKFECFEAKKDDGKFVSNLKDKGLLIAEVEVEHEYPHCERCKSPVIFRPTDQWFLKVSALKERMLEENEKVNWVPEWAGAAQFKKWLENIKDWCISRQRFWGVPLPVWKCSSCKNVEVIGGVDELKKYCSNIPSDLHRPSIDEVKWKCKKCRKGEMKRLTDVVDVWIDSACAPFASLEYPKNKKLLKEWGNQPDFILEAKDQIRGWFYSLMGAGVICFDKVPYKSVYMHGWMNDEKGIGMSKRLGNYESMDKIIADFGADLFRFYTITSTSPGNDVNYSRNEMNESYRDLNVLWNLSQLLIKNTRYAEHTPSKTINKRYLKTEDKWILSRINSKIKECTELLDAYQVNKYSTEMAEFFLEDLSRAYIKMIRTRLDTASKAEKATILNILYNVYMDALKLLSPLIPYLTESIYQNMREEYKLKEKSVHEFRWPKHNANLIDRKLEASMSVMKEVLQATLAAREKAGITLRWPIGEVLIYSDKKDVGASLLKTRETFIEQANIKKYRLLKELPEGVTQGYKLKLENFRQHGALVPKILSDFARYSFKNVKSHFEKEGYVELMLENKKIKVSKDDVVYEEKVSDKIKTGEFRAGKVFITAGLDKNLIAEGYSRELKRRIQEARKKMKLRKPDRIKVLISSDKEMIEMIKPSLKEISKVTGCDELLTATGDGTQTYSYSESFKIKDKDISMGVTVLRHN